MFDQGFIDTTLLELWGLRGRLNGELTTREEYERKSQDIAFRAINTIKMLQKEIDRLKEESKN